MEDRNEFRRIAEMEEEIAEKKRKRRSCVIWTAVFAFMVIVTLFLFFSYADQRINKGVFRIFDLTEGDTELDADIEMEFDKKVVAWFLMCEINQPEFTDVEDSEMQILFNMFHAENEEELLEHMREFYGDSVRDVSDSSCSLVGVKWFNDKKSLSKELENLFGEEFKIEDAYIVKANRNSELGNLEADFFFYKIENEWHMLPYISTIKEVIA
ncbi:MAG: hypothetical protein ACI39R_07485 [Lachnospiraceae bacterium]